jgi:hypothetical protein
MANHVYPEPLPVGSEILYDYFAGVEPMMTHANVFRIEEVGKDFAVFGHVRYNFDDGENCTKEEAAAFFRHLKGKMAAIEAPESAIDGTGHFYISVDFMESDGGYGRVMPIPFAVSSVEISV